MNIFSFFMFIAGVFIFVIAGIIFDPNISDEAIANASLPNVSYLNHQNLILEVFPHYSLAEIVSNLNTISVTSSFCKQQCDQTDACINQESICRNNTFCCGMFSNSQFLIELIFSIEKLKPYENYFRN